MAGLEPSGVHLRDVRLTITGREGPRNVDWCEVEALLVGPDPAGLYGLVIFDWRSPTSRRQNTLQLVAANFTHVNNRPVQPQALPPPSGVDPGDKPGSH